MSVESFRAWKILFSLASDRMSDGLERSNSAYFAALANTAARDRHVAISEMSHHDEEGGSDVTRCASERSRDCVVDARGQHHIHCCIRETTTFGSHAIVLGRSNPCGKFVDRQSHGNGVSFTIV